MAYVERYVRHDAGGGGAGTEGDPWTFEEALTNQAPADRTNVKSSGSYSISADAFTNAGTQLAPIMMRGYSDTIGDLQNPGRSPTTGKIDKTGFPAITLTGILTPNAFCGIQNLAITGALSSALISSNTIDNFNIFESEVINTQNDAAARAILLDNSAVIIGSDLECTGASHNSVSQSDTSCSFLFNRIKSVADSGLQTLGGVNVIMNLLIGNGAGVAIQQDTSITSNDLIVVLNTIYNWDTVIETPNAGPGVKNLIITANHITDCSKFINNLYAATAAYAFIEMNNRTRDNTTPRTGVFEMVLSGEVTEDTGGPETDYVNAGADNFGLISGAPGLGANTMGFGEPDIGAWVHAVGAGGGAASILGAGGLGRL